MNKYIVYIEEQKLVNWRDGGKASKGEYSLNKLRYVKVSNTGRKGKAKSEQKCCQVWPILTFNQI